MGDSGSSKQAGSTNQVSKRLNGELMKLMMSGDKGISGFPDGDNLLSWVGTVEGPPDSVYQGLKYKLRLDFPAGYPYNPPTVKFSTPCFHPNVDQHGNICLDILKEKWSATYSVSTILQSLRSLLSDPNNDSPLNSVAAQLWDNQEQYKVVLHKKYAEAASGA